MIPSRDPIQADNTYLLLFSLPFLINQPSGIGFEMNDRTHDQRIGLVNTLLSCRRTATKRNEEQKKENIKPGKGEETSNEKKKQNKQYKCKNG